MTPPEYQTLSESLAERRRRGRIESRGGVIHGVECYEAWRDLRDCPHEEDRP